MLTKRFLSLAIPGVLVLHVGPPTRSHGEHAPAGQASPKDTVGVERFVGGPGHRDRVRTAGAISMPVVVLVSGLGGGVDDWKLVQGRMAQFARVISYDRPGIGKSDLSAEPRRVSQMAGELHEMLAILGERGPYILCGHSLGGLVADVYASRWPNEVAALLLVDPADGAFQDRAKGLPSHAVAAQRQEQLRKTAPAGIRAELEALDSSYADAQRIAQLPRIPMTMLIAGHHAQAPTTPLDSLRRDPTEQLWRTTHNEWIARQPLGKAVLDEKSGHYIQRDDPDLVVDQLRSLITSAARRAGR